MAAENGWDMLVTAFEKRKELEDKSLKNSLSNSGGRVLSTDPEAHETLAEINDKVDEILDLLRELKER